MICLCRDDPDKTPRDHTIRGSGMSSKKIIFFKSNLKLYRSLVRNSRYFALFIEVYMLMVMMYTQADFHFPLLQLIKSDFVLVELSCWKAKLERQFSVFARNVPWLLLGTYIG